MAKLDINYRIINFNFYLFLQSKSDYSGHIERLDGFLRLSLCVANSKQRWEKGALGSCIGAGGKKKKSSRGVMVWCVVCWGTDPCCQIHCRSIPIRERGEAERTRPGKQI